MLMITELLTQTPGPLWRLVKQADINHVVTCSTAASSCGDGRSPGSRTGRRRSWPRRGVNGPGTARRWPGCRPPTGSTDSSSR